MSDFSSLSSGVVQVVPRGMLMSGQVGIVPEPKPITGFHPDTPQAAPAWAVADWLEEHGWDVLAHVVRNGEMTR